MSAAAAAAAAAATAVTPVTPVTPITAAAALTPPPPPPTVAVPMHCQATPWLPLCKRKENEGPAETSPPRTKLGG